MMGGGVRGKEVRVKQAAEPSRDIEPLASLTMLSHVLLTLAFLHTFSSFTGTMRCTHMMWPTQRALRVLPSNCTPKLYRRQPLATPRPKANLNN
eukprot:14903558-Heterocapsa_arctica.AAC.1